MGHSLHLVCSAGPRTASSWCQKQKGAQVQPPLWDGAAGMEACRMQEDAASWAVCSLRTVGRAAGY